MALLVGSFVVYLAIVGRLPAYWQLATTARQSNG